MEILSIEMQTLVKTGSALRTMFEEGKRMAKEFGAENVYDFSLGNPSVPAPEEFNRALTDAVRETESGVLHGYMSNAGYEDTRKAVADNLNKRFAAALKKENIIMTVGAANALVAAMKMLLNPGDEVCVFAPFFLEYRNYIANFGGVTKIIPANPPSFLPDINALKSALSEKCKAVIINNPNNPTGVIYPEETIRQIAAALKEAGEKYGHPVFLITDEPYRELAYDGAKVPFVTKYYENTIVCYSFSKSLSIPGERIGYMAIPDEAAQSESLCAAAAIAVRVLGCVNAPSLQQKAIIKVLDCLADVSAYDKNRKLMMQGLGSAGLSYAKPEGAFYMFVKTPTPDDKEFTQRAKDKYHLLFTEGSAFYCPGYVRIAYCVPYERIERALPYFKALADEYR